MKIKLDYITNSSSVSFCGWGIRLKFVPERLWHFLYDYATKHNNKNKYYIEKSQSFEEFIISGQVTGVFQDFISDYCHLKIRYCCESDELFIGLCSDKTIVDYPVKDFAAGGYEYIDEDIEKIKNIFKSLFLETSIVDFIGFCDKIEFINVEWYS